MANTRPLRPTLLALCCSLGFNVHAADAPLELGATAINADALKPASGQLPETFAGGQVARGGQMGVLGNQDMMDVPFTQTSYTSQLIEDQQAEDIGDVLLNDPSVRQSFGFGNQSQVFVIRGLPLSGDDVSFNGLYGVLPRQMISTDALERVELFKGPNAFLNGASPTGTGLGGNVNLQPKRAGDVPTRRYTQDISSDGRIGEHLDIGQRFGEDNRFGARVNLSQREGETAVDDQDQRSKLFVAGLDYRGDALRLSGDFGYQKQRVNHMRNTVRLGAGVTDIPRAPSADHNYGQDWGWTQTEDTFGMLRADYDFNEHWSGYVSGGAKRTHETGFYGTPVLTDAATGAATIGGSQIPHNEDNVSFMTGLNGRFQTGPVSHQLNLGAATIWTEQENAYVFYKAKPTNIYDTTPLSRPTAVSLSAGRLSDPGVTGKTHNRSLALSDTLGLFDDTLLLTAGVRRQQLRVEGYAYRGTGVDAGRTAFYDEAVTTPVYGIVYKLNPSVSLYANSIQGLAQGATASGEVVNLGQVFPPAKTKQVEAGIKLDRQSYGANLAVFRIERPTDGYREGNLFVQDGQQINKGVELSVFGEPIQGLRLMAGGTRMDTELKNTQNGTNDGNHAVGVPTFQLNASVDWDVPGLDGVALNARMLRTGGQYANPGNTLTLPTWNRFDVGARYRVKVQEKDVTLRVNVENLTDKNYWASANGGYLTQGDPRLVKFSGTIDF
ncbi:TonB-dependent siderophore receptor [Pseudomonas sp. S75]|uniref:TonB-dependent receptor n=1 Tax=unclassified Pseudomonas TaxID=196821 RepID=UPI0019058794|nr:MULTISPECIES: TonB-dependent siderophore receptor [unclassified Pseudomonas]MBJ9973904.1 TonB-dependent siderophore receptor [Pseudomonas sp. S30]MBK0152166.1 TonB-dependent siderophore receptor [Pseudomonas sp. S75]